MTLLRYLLVLILFSSGLFSAVTIYFVLVEAFDLRIDWSKHGVVYFLSQFSEFKNLYTATVAVFSVYYWTIQMESILQSNRRIEESKRNLKKDNALRSEERRVGKECRSGEW